MIYKAISDRTNTIIAIAILINAVEHHLEFAGACYNCNARISEVSTVKTIDK